MAGHSPSKTGVNALVSRPSTSFFLLGQKQGVDARDKRGHDERESGRENINRRKHMPNTLDHVRQEVAVANRILANEGIIDAFGHISMRHPSNPNRYFISRHRASELVEPSDVLEFDLDSKPVVPTSLRLYSEMVI